jgi:hypothetical protein
VGTTETFSIWEGDTQISPTVTFDGDSGSGGNNYFSADTTALVTSSGITTISEVVTLTATEAGGSGGDGSLATLPATPDSGLTLVLLGFGMGGLFLFSIVRHRKA